MQLKVTTESVEDTYLLAKAIGARLRGGEIIQLKGDVGAGKTAFTTGLVEGLESDDPVSSPTFTICNTYHGRLMVHHCDFYRLHDDVLIQQELDELIDGEAVIVLEWAENIPTLKDIEHIAVNINSEGENTRVFELHIPEKYGYLGQ